MRPKRKIILHTPRLIKIRANLRALLEQAYLSKLSSMSRQKHMHLELRVSAQKNNYSSDNEKLLIREKATLMNTYSQSILFCSLGASCISKRDKTREQIYDIKLERDMVWAPWLGGWICLQCYNFFCIQQYHFDVKKRDFDKEKRFLELLKKHNTR